jgi:hypothetical protein
MNIKQITPTVAPQSGILTLYTANGTSSYFTRDITSMLTSNIGSWNNLTIPIGTSEWQSIGSPNWTEVTGLKLSITYATSEDITILLQGVFFRGQYLTQTNMLGVGPFFGVAVYSIVMQIACQWMILTAIAYLILKGLKASNVVWSPLVVAIGFTLIALVITSIIALLCTFALPIIHYPYDFPPYVSLIYPDFIVNGASPTSQTIYESITATTTTYTTINTAITILMYVWQIVLVTFAIKAVSGHTYIRKDTQSPNTTTSDAIKEEKLPELSYTKSILIAVGTVVLTTILLNIISWIGIF